MSDDAPPEGLAGIAITLDMIRRELTKLREAVERLVPPQQ